MTIQETIYELLKKQVLNDFSEPINIECLIPFFYDIGQIILFAEIQETFPELTYAMVDEYLQGDRRSLPDDYKTDYNDALTHYKHIFGDSGKVLILLFKRLYANIDKYETVESAYNEILKKRKEYNLSYSDFSKASGALSKSSKFKSRASEFFNICFDIQHNYYVDKGYIAQILFLMYKGKIPSEKPLLKEGQIIDFYLEHIEEKPIFNTFSEFKI